MVARINVCVAIAFVALGVAGCGGSSKDVRGRKQLIQLLAVLRRPQTKADRNPAMLRTIERQPQWSPYVANGSRPDLALVRLGTIGPWGARILLVPFTPPTSVPHCTGTERACARPPPREETLAVFPSSGARKWTAAQIAAGVAFTQTPSDGRWIIVVPDAVTRVAFVLSDRRPTVVVRGNVAAVQGHAGERIDAALWYGAHGRLLRRIRAGFNL
ncbi:MAG TPA: hypothetical protein VGI87_04510 [Solirubrobacteraceae bacterium]|jgi:hypothetical protein